MNLIQKIKYALGLIFAFTGFTSINAMENFEPNTPQAGFNTPEHHLNAGNFTAVQHVRKAKRSLSIDDTASVRLEFESEATPLFNPNDSFHTPVSKKSRVFLPLHAETEVEISRPQSRNLRSIFDFERSPNDTGLADLPVLPAFASYHHTAVTNLNFLFSPETMNFLDQMENGTYHYEENTANEIAEDTAAVALLSLEDFDN